MADSLFAKKLKRTLQNALSAWWVLLIIAAYMFLAWLFTGTSCVLASTVGLPCPGCGSTRAFLTLLRGDIAASLRYYPMLMPAIALACMYAAFSLFRERRPRCLDKVLIGFVIVVLVVYAARMVLMFPNETPMTFNEQALLPRVVSWGRFS